MVGWERSSRPANSHTQISPPRSWMSSTIWTRDGCESALSVAASLAASASSPWVSLRVPVPTPCLPIDRTVLDFTQS